MAGVGSELMKNIRYEDGLIGMLAAFRYPLAIVVGIGLFVLVESHISPLPSNGEIGFLGLVLIGHHIAPIAVAGIAVWGLLFYLFHAGTRPCGDDEKPDE